MWCPFLYSLAVHVSPEKVVEKNASRVLDPSALAHMDYNALEKTRDWIQQQTEVSAVTPPVQPVQVIRTHRNPQFLKHFNLDCVYH